jgi:hypothetical protein
MSGVLGSCLSVQCLQVKVRSALAARLDGNLCARARKRWPTRSVVARSETPQALFLLGQARGVVGLGLLCADGAVLCSVEGRW